MIISSGEFLQDDSPGHGACMFLKLLMEIAKMPPKKLDHITPSGTGKRSLPPSAPALGVIPLNPCAFQKGQTDCILFSIS